MNISRSTLPRIIVAEDSRVTIDYMDQAKIPDEANDYVAVDLIGMELGGADTLYISLKHINEEAKKL